MATRNVSKLKPRGNVPLSAYKHSIVFENNVLFYLGGSGSNKKPLQRSSCFDTKKFFFKNMIFATPLKVDSHSCVFNNNTYYVYGGNDLSLTDKKKSNLYEIKIDNQKLRIQKCGQKGDIPVGRKDHTAVNTGNEMVIIGGISLFDNKVLNDYYSYNYSTSNWKKLGEFPINLCNHCSIFDKERKKIITFGGSDGSKKISKTFSIKLSDFSCIEETFEKTCTARSNFGSCIVNGNLFIYGGELEDKCVSDAWCLELSTMTWFQLSKKLGPERTDSKLFFDGEFVFSFGGKVAKTKRITNDFLKIKGKELIEKYVKIDQSKIKKVEVGSEKVVEEKPKVKTSNTDFGKRGVPNFLKSKKVSQTEYGKKGVPDFLKKGNKQRPNTPIRNKKKVPPPIVKKHVKKVPPPVVKKHVKKVPPVVKKHVKKVPPPVVKKHVKKVPPPIVKKHEKKVPPPIKNVKKTPPPFVQKNEKKPPPVVKKTKKSIIKKVFASTSAQSLGSQLKKMDLPTDFDDPKPSSKNRTSIILTDNIEIIKPSDKKNRTSKEFVKEGIKVVRGSDNNKEKERLEKEKQEKERILQKKLERERLEKKKQEEKERLEKEKQAKERILQKKLERERLEKKKQEEKERLERLEKEKQEKEMIEQERLEKERKEREKREEERIEKEKNEKKRREEEKQEKLRKALLEKEQQEREEEEQKNEEEPETEETSPDIQPIPIKIIEANIKPVQVLDNTGELLVGEIAVVNVENKGVQNTRVKEREKFQDYEIKIPRFSQKKYSRSLFNEYIKKNFSFNQIVSSKPLVNEPPQRYFDYKSMRLGDNSDMKEDEVEKEVVKTRKNKNKSDSSKLQKALIKQLKRKSRTIRFAENVFEDIGKIKKTNLKNKYKLVAKSKVDIKIPPLMKPKKYVHYIKIHQNPNMSFDDKVDISAQIRAVRVKSIRINKVQHLGLSPVDMRLSKRKKNRPALSMHKRPKRTQKRSRKRKQLDFASIQKF